MRIWIPIALVLLLSGCSGILEVRDKAFIKGRQFYDDALITAVLWKCRVASVGSIERRYMRTDDTWLLWTEECLAIGAPKIPDRDETEIEALPEVRPE